MRMRQPLITRDFRIDLPQVSECVDKLTHDGLKPIGQAFATNLERSLAIPGTINALLRLWFGEVQEGEELLKRVVHEARAHGAPLSDEEIDAIRRETEDRALRMRWSVDWQEQVSPLVESALAELVASSPKLRSGTDAMVSSSIINAWISFETLVQDTLEMLFLERPKRLNQLFQNQIPRLRSYRKISDTFKIVFSCEETDVFFSNELESKGEDAKNHLAWLDRLAETRHLLVHRAGIVDQAYKNKTGSEAPLGTEYDPDKGEIPSLLNIAAFAGCAFLRYTDQWLRVEGRV
jgi:hypothetical protein